MSERRGIVRCATCGYSAVDVGRCPNCGTTLRRLRRGEHGLRVVLELDDGQELCALDQLSAHQADYVEQLLDDALRLTRRA